MTRLSPRSRRVLPALVAAMLALLVVLPVSARESRDLGNGLVFDVGFIMEPPVQNDTNGLRLRVTSNADPVPGLESTLNARVTFAGETRELPLTPVDNEPGTYTSVFIPTQPGEYSFRISGAIGDQEIDETFHADPNGVPLVASRLDYEFPTAAHGDLTNLAFPAGAALLLAGIAGVLVRRQRLRP